MKEPLGPRGKQGMHIFVHFAPFSKSFCHLMLYRWRVLLSWNNFSLYSAASQVFTNNHYSCIYTLSLSHFKVYHCLPQIICLLFISQIQFYRTNFIPRDVYLHISVSVFCVGLTWMIIFSDCFQPVPR